MRLSNISMFGQQNSLINVDRINQSVSKQPHPSKSTHRIQMGRDRVTISPKGKMSSLIDNLNKQKANILEQRDQFLEQARKQGQTDDMLKPQLEQFDQQIKDIDKQIQEATLKKMQEAADKSAPKVKSNKPKTEQDIQNDILSNITASAATLDRIEATESQKNKIDGRVDVLKSEIELDRGRDTTGSGQESIAAKEALVSQMQSQSQGLMQDISRGINEVHEILEENNELAATKPAEDDKDKVNNKDDNNEVNAKDDKTVNRDSDMDRASASSKLDENETVSQTENTSEIQH